MSLSQKEFFDNLAKTNYNEERGKSFAINRITKIVTDFVLKGASREARLLEIGCGKGHWTLEFLSLGYRVTAVDFSQNSLNFLESKARQKGLENRLELLRADVLNHPFSPHFDRVFCINTLHHISDPSLAIKNMSDALVPGGYLSVLEPNPLNLWWWLGAPLFDKFYNLKMELGMAKTNPWQLSSYLKEAGLENIDYQGLELFPAISPDRFSKIIEVEKVLMKLPGVEKLTSASLVSGRKSKFYI